MKAVAIQAAIRLVSAAAHFGRGLRNPPDPETVGRIVVFQMSGVGDLLLTTPALRALHRLYPHARIDVMTYRLGAGAFLFRLPYVGRGCECPLFDLELKRCWTPAFRRAWADPIRFLHDEPVDLYVSFHHTWLPQWYLLELLLAARSGARFRVGINPDIVTGAGVFDRALHERELGGRHYREFFLDVVGLLGDAGKDIATEFPLMEEERREAAVRIRLGIPERTRTVCLHVGASHASKQWPLERYIGLAKRLEERGCGVLLVGAASERVWTDQIARALRPGSVLDLAGRTSLFELAACIDQSSLFIGNDSGPLHIAIARRRPAIGLIGPGQPRYVGYDPAEAMILQDGTPRPAYEGIAHKEAPWLWKIGVDDVFGAAMTLIT